MQAKAHAASVRGQPSTDSHALFKSLDDALASWTPGSQLSVRSRNMTFADPKQERSMWEAARGEPSSLECWSNP